MRKDQNVSSVYGVAEGLAFKLEQSCPDCNCVLMCDHPRHHITVIVIGTYTRLINRSYVLWVHSPSGNEDQPSFLSPEAEQMLENVEAVVKSSGGAKLGHSTSTGEGAAFWYAGPYIDNDLLLEDSRVVARETGTPVEVFDRVWGSDLDMVDKRAQRHVSPYMFSYRCRGGAFGWLWYQHDETVSMADPSDIGPK